MNRQILILKNPAIRIRVHPDYLLIREDGRDQVIGFVHIAAIYLNRANSLSLNAATRICRQVPLYLIDKNGTIIAEVKDIHDA